MVRDADTPAITPSFTSMLPAFSGSFTDANGFTGAAISKPAVSLRQPSPDTVHTSPGCSKQRSFTLAGMTKPESIWPTAPPSDGAAPENALSNRMVTLLVASRPNVKSPAAPLMPGDFTFGLDATSSV